MQPHLPAREPAAPLAATSLDLRLTELRALAFSSTGEAERLARAMPRTTATDPSAGAT